MDAHEVSPRQRLDDALDRAGIEHRDLVGSDGPLAFMTILQRLRAIGFDGPIEFGVTSLSDAGRMIDAWNERRPA